MTQAQRDAIEAQIDHDVECSDKELSDAGVWREIGPGGINEDIDSVNYVWDWGHSTDGDPCFYVRSPLHRPLTIDETRDFLTVAQELPSLQFTASISEGGAKRKAGAKKSLNSVTQQKEKKSH